MVRSRQSAPESTLRIIAGSLRGRLIRFKADGIRPTGDRVRETLFNWLAGRLEGTRCLDMFAGTGALGIEAASRGADSVLFVEQNPVAVADLRRNLQELGCSACSVMRGNALQQPFAAHGPFDLVFLDPPFDGFATADLCKLLNSLSCLSAGALIYIEVAKDNALPELPAGWQVLREKTAGQVRYALLQSATEST